MFWDRVKIIVMVLAFGFIIYINENVLVNLIFSNDTRIFNWFYVEDRWHNKYVILIKFRFVD